MFGARIAALRPRYRMWAALDAAHTGWKWWPSVSGSA